MSKNTEYSANQIKVLSDRDHVRLRTQVYLGSTNPASYNVPIFADDQFVVKPITFIPAVFKAFGEIVDNSIDEFAQITIPNKTLTIEANPLLGTYTVSDNGRGIPITKHETGPYTPEVALGSLRSGRNFEDELANGVIGQNGVGSACTNYCSTVFSVTIHRDNKVYRQEFTDGALHVSKPSIRRTTSSQTGTSVSFQLDSDVFRDPTLPDELIWNKAIEIAFTNPGVTTIYNKHKFRFPRGLDDVLKRSPWKDYYKFADNGFEFFVVPDAHEGLDEQIFTWVNSSLLFDGGLCNTQFINAFCDKVISHLSAAAKKNKCEITKNDVRRGLMVLGNIKISNPEYDAQSKTRLVGPNLRKEISTLIDDGWSSFARRNKDWLNVILERAIVRHHSTENKKAQKKHQQQLKKKIVGLVDATSKNRSECQLLITEGDSAASMITDARDPKTTASLPLRGKFNNVYGATIAQILKMGKISDMLSAIGLVPGVKAYRNDLRYGRVVIATDADYDGSDIFTLAINLFFHLWPELFDPQYPPYFYRLIAPNVCATKGKSRVHFATHDLYERSKQKYANYTIDYYKGLGSMVRQDWEMILSGKTNTLIPIQDDGNMKNILTLLFSPDSNARKEWLQNDK